MTPITTLPDCPNCDSADTLTEDWSEQGSRFCHCSCCSLRCRVDEKNRAHRIEVTHDVSDNYVEKEY